MKRTVGLLLLLAVLMSWGCDIGSQSEMTPPPGTCV